jgi:hypothetical protein
LRRPIQIRWCRLFGWPAYRTFEPRLDEHERRVFLGGWLHQQRALARRGRIVWKETWNQENDDDRDEVNDD